MILLLGAEINAFFAEGIRATPDNLPVMAHRLTSHLQTSEKDIQEQAPPSHKQTEPVDIRPRSQAQSLQAKADNTPVQAQPARTDQADHQQKKRKSSSQGSSRAYTIIEALVGTAFAFVVQFFQLRRKK